MQIAIDIGLFCHCRVNGKPVSYEEALSAKRAGLMVQWHVPCGKNDPYAMPDINRAIPIETEHLVVSENHEFPVAMPTRKEESPDGTF